MSMPIFVNDYFTSAYKTPEGISLRRGNVISSLLDNSSGEQLSFVKVDKYFDGSVMDDSKVDGIIYRKLVDEYFVDSDYAASGIIKAQRFGVIPGGITDNYTRFSRLFRIGFLGRIVFPSKQKYFLSNYISLNNSFNIDFNGSEIIAPRGVISRSDTPISFTLGSYTVKKNDMYFPRITGITDTVRVGTVMLIRSLTPYWQQSNLYDGQVLVVIGEDDNNFILSTPIYKTFQVDVIELYEGANAKIENLILDMTNCTGAYKGFNIFCYKDVFIKNLKAYGSDAAAAGVEVVADNVVIRDSETQHFLNTIGTGSGEGRLGYGFAANGNNVYLENLKGNRCKHIVTCNHRTIITISFRVIGFQGFNPAEEFDRVGEAAGHGSLYQSALDVHPNCVNASLDNILYDGCNGAITIRNGNATINSPKIRSRAVTNVSSSTSLIEIFEHEVENILINNPEIYIDTAVEGQAETISFIGFKPALTPLQNGNILVTNGIQYGGKLFTMYVTNEASHGVSFKRISFENLKGYNLEAGITINGTSKFRVGTIEEIKLTGNIVMTEDSDVNTRIMNVEYIDQIDIINMSNSSFNCRGIRAGFAFRLIMPENSSPPLELNFSQSNWQTGSSALCFTYNHNSIEGRAWGRAVFDNTIIQYNLNAAEGQNFIIGVYNQSLKDFDKEWSFDGCKIMNGNSILLESQNECVRFPNKSKLNIENLTLSGDLFVPDSIFFRERATLGDIPYNAKKIGGYLPYLGFRLKDRRLFVATVVQTSPGTKNAIPRYAPLFEHQVVYNEGFNGIAPFAWVAYEGTWKKIYAFE